MLIAEGVAGPEKGGGAGAAASASAAAGEWGKLKLITFKNFQLKFLQRNRKKIIY